MKLSIKHYPISKPAITDGKALTYHWQSVDYSPSQIVQHITSGKPIAVGQYQTGHRKKANFTVSELVALDYDENYSDAVYAGLIASPFIQKHAFAVIQTASSKQDSRRCRVLFRLDQPVYDAGDYGDLVRYILEIAPYGADHAAVDPARAFYGSKPGTIADFYNPYNVLSIAPILSEIRDQRKRKQELDALRPASEALPEDYIEAIESALGVTGFNREGWSNRVACPIGKHEHDDTNPAAAWHKDKHILKCLKCHSAGDKYLAWQIAKALGIERHREVTTALDRSDLSQAPNEHFSQPDKKVIPFRAKSKYADLITLPGALRKPMLRDKATNLCLIIDVLLWTQTPVDRLITRQNIVQAMADYGMGQTAVYRVFDNFSRFLNVVTEEKRYPSNIGKNSKAGRKAAVYTLENILSTLEKHYAYSIFTTGDLLYDHENTLCSARDYRKYALLENFSTLEMSISGKKLAQEFNVSTGTISSYTRELREEGLLEINSHFKRRVLHPDEFPNLRDVLEEWREMYSNSFIEMYRTVNGIRVQYCHNGGKRGIPNNRIPPLYNAVMHFFTKSLKNHTVKGDIYSETDIVFVLVTKCCNSYRRIPTRDYESAAA